MLGTFRLLIAALGVAWSATVLAQTPPLVLAASSLQESLTSAGDAWASLGHQKPIISFAASSALARQIESGAPADLFISADEEWMDAIAKSGLIRTGSRVSFLGNRLVLIAPAGSNGNLAIRPGMPLAQLLGKNRLAVADPDAVPAGRYAQQALTSLKVWSGLQSRLARAENVRAALAFVERGEAPYGVVYETDAKASRKVRIVGYFPARSHMPITYPIALLKTSTSSDAEAFRRFLISPRGKAIFRRFGFSAD